MAEPATIELSAVRSEDLGQPGRTSAYCWLILALSCGLMATDYMTRVVLTPVFPMIKAEWMLSDTRVGWIAGIVPLSVGLLTIPLSFLADRWGRVRSVTLMAILWSLATILCASAQSYGQLLAGRVLLGVGEAAYGSIGLAIVFSAFPQSLRATAASIFLASGFAGQVLGVSLGGDLAVAFGWRGALMTVGIASLAFALPYPLLVRQQRLAPASGQLPASLLEACRSALMLIASKLSLCLTYLASGLQYFAVGALPAWLPTYLSRYYGMPLPGAAGVTAAMLLAGGGGMILCGMVSDRLARRRPDSMASAAVAISLITAFLVFLAFRLGPGTAQLASLFAAMFFLKGTAGPANAIIARLTPVEVHGSALAVHALAINLLGLASGPVVIGWLADAVGLVGALQILPLSGIVAALLFALARHVALADTRG